MNCVMARCKFMFGGIIIPGRACNAPVRLKANTQSTNSLKRINFFQNVQS